VHFKRIYYNEKLPLKCNGSSSSSNNNTLSRRAYYQLTAWNQWEIAGPRRLILTLHATHTGEVGSKNSVLVIKPIGNKPVEELCRNGKIILKCNLSWVCNACWWRQDSFHDTFHCSDLVNAVINLRIQQEEGIFWLVYRPSAINNDCVLCEAYV
jgi:hypothetical protein